MTNPDCNDAPSPSSPSRRKVVIGGALLAGSVAAALPLPSTRAVPSPEFDAQFMALSHLLIPHRLDPVIGRRIARAMHDLRPSPLEHVSALIAIATKRNAAIVEDFFPDVPDGPLKEAALSIISAWYTGVVADAPDAQVIAYEEALMYQPTSDVMTIPTYAKSRPNGWNADAPPLGVMPEF